MERKEILLYQGTAEDKSYGHMLRPYVGTATVFTMFQDVANIMQIVIYCQQRNITGVISSSHTTLCQILTSINGTKTVGSLDAYQGSYFVYCGIEFVFIAPLAHLVKVPHGKFITERFVSKLTNPSKWAKMPAFNYSILTPTNATEIFERFKLAVAMSVDIETVKENLRITYIGYTALFVGPDNSLHTETCVLEVNDLFALALMRKFNWELKCAKVLQNGKYDIAYLARYNAVLYNYLWDTSVMFHCMYAELPKDLAFLAAFFAREGANWKDLAKTADKAEYIKYNALDTHATILVFIAWILEAPTWAKRNYREEFPILFPCHMVELIGIKRDIEMLEVANKEATEQIEATDVQLSKMLGTYPAIFNINSAPQNAKLRKVLGCSDIESSDDKSLVRIGARHPLNRAIVNKIQFLRKQKKLVSTYLCVGDKAKELNGRVLYKISPDGTETGRCASQESSFWCGLQIQNITRGPSVKKTLVADDGFMLAEVDLKQNETWDTAYASGDKQLIAALASEKDFHALNASAFFGIAYDKIFDDATCKTLDKALRDLSKRVNHGANYLMGEEVLIDTMGEEKVWEAKRLLNLPQHYGLRDIAHHLLEAFHAKYSSLRKVYYPGVVKEVATTKMLTSKAVILSAKRYDHECILRDDFETAYLAGWTRYCFGQPDKNKLDKNAYVAHVSQSLAAKVLNEAFLRVFYEIAMNPRHSSNFKLLAQIHDSILFQFREGHEYLAEMVRQLIQIPVRIRGYDGIVRTFKVPADIKAGKDGKGAKRWSETE